MSRWTTITEQAIQPFTLDRKNWVIIITFRGAEDIAILYILVEDLKGKQLEAI